MSFDIMMPFYGRIDHFREAVESVLAQSDPDWRLVVLDDHHPDESAGRWLTGLADERISYHRHDVNVGINQNFRECVERSSADLVTIFGCDDRMHAGYVARMKALATDFPDGWMFHPGVRIIDEHGEPVRTLVDSAKAWYRPHATTPISMAGERLASSVTRGNWMNFPAVAWNGPHLRSTGFRQGYDVVQDLALVIDLCIAGGTLIVDDRIEFDYRRHAASVSSWRAADGSRFLEERAFFVEVERIFRELGWPRAARAARGHISSRINALTRVPSAIRSGDRSGRRVLIRHAISRTPRVD